MKNDPKFVRDSNSTLKVLTFQLSNVRELETIKYAFATQIEYKELLANKKLPRRFHNVGCCQFAILNRSDETMILQIEAILKVESAING